MVRSAKQVYRLTGRAAMYSPGAPSLGNEIERRFLATDRDWHYKREGSGGGRRTSSSGLALVPLSWWHATIHVQTYRWSILVVP